MHLFQCLRATVSLPKNFQIINSAFSGRLDIDISYNTGIISESVICDILTNISRVRDLVISRHTWKELVEDPYMIGKKKKEPNVIFSKVPQCLVSSLKFVEWKRSISGYEGEMELVRYFLKNSKLLEKFRLRTYYTEILCLRT
ncbi:unnamed protein product [Arabidopsis thaliana]|uniref:FBD domain-containing protein n=1 Tax=Arabidopsis thaliana TaxID=3702 RepID=A0A654GAL1_ARATH|nr:unnamed protein product [Arabidopsis thaliana]